MRSVRNQHPLENDYVLWLIFQKLPYKDLKSCRQVNYLWMVESSKQMRKVEKSEIQISKLVVFADELRRSRSTWQKAPFVSAFRLMNCSVASLKFWRHCGPYIRRLTISAVTFQSATAVIRALCISCPKLERLCVDGLKIADKTNVRETLEVANFSNVYLKTISSDYKSARVLAECGVQILDHFPGLQSLNVTKGSRGKSGDLFFRSVSSARKVRQDILNLKQVSVYFDKHEVPDSMLPALVESRLKLEALAFWYDGSLELKIEQAKVTSEIIDKHGDSLQILFLPLIRHFVMESILQRPNNGVYPLVEKLYLGGMRDIRILRLFPKLKTLQLTSVELQGFPPVEEMDINRNVTQLQLHTSSTDYKFQEQKTLRLVAKCFPNLEELKMDAPSYTVFKLVCRLFPNLKLLWWEKGLLMDDDITGYAEKAVDRINRKGAACEWRPTARKPNITWLTNLETFIWTELENRPGYCAAKYGILELPNLKNLYVSYGHDIDGDSKHEEYWKGVMAQFNNDKPKGMFEIAELFNEV